MKLKQWWWMPPNLPSNDQKKQKKYYSGKKKRHTIKTHVLINTKDLKILKTNFTNGKRHDFRLYKESKPLILLILKDTLVKTDTGCQGIQKIHLNSIIPFKRKRNSKLSKEEKIHNHNLASKRIFVEHIIGRLKRFKVISERYRNRRRKFGLRFNLIAGIYNYEI